LDQTVISFGTVFERVHNITEHGQVLSETDLIGLRERTGFPSIGVHRADLQRVLADAIDASRLRTGHACVGFEQNQSGVRARFDNGWVEEGEFLIGADGIHSAVRAQLLGKATPRYAGYTAWRGVAPGRSSDLPAGVTYFWLGRGAQAGALSCGAGRVYWFVTRNAPANQLVPADSNRDHLLAVLGRWPAPLPGLIEATNESAIVQNDIIDRPPAWTWGQGRVTLLGDAIHPTTPNLGQGACQALEDAVVLADALRRTDSVEAGLRHYEQRRRQRTAFVTKQSWSMGKVFQLQNPLLVWLRNRILWTGFSQRHADAVLRQLLDYELPELNTARCE
jgi:2-polyprenyl-6-methoxyphenol hydroxylase-like FAD-dependent oxidoreductase